MLTQESAWSFEILTLNKSKQERKSNHPPEQPFSLLSYFDIDIDSHAMNGRRADKKGTSLPISIPCSTAQSEPKT